MASAATAPPAAATTTTKPLSTWSKFTSVFREAHPIGRVPAYLKAHDLPGLAYYFRRMGRTGALFAPLMVGFFGWPFLMKGLINASNGVKVPKAKSKSGKSHRMSRKSSIDSEAWSQRAPVGA